jgi:hypothetical protein
MLTLAARAAGLGRHRPVTCGQVRAGEVECCDPGPCAFCAFFCCLGSAYAATSLDNAFFHDGKAAALPLGWNNIRIRRYPQSTGVPNSQLIAGASNDRCGSRLSHRRPVDVPTGATIHSAKRDKPTFPAANANLGIALSGPLGCSVNDFPRR